MQHRRLKAAKTEIIGAAQPGARQAIGASCQSERFTLLQEFFFNLLCRLLNGGATGIAQAENTRNFVECFSGGIVACAAKKLIPSMTTHQHQFAMPTRNYEANQRKGRVAFLVFPIGFIGFLRSPRIGLLAQPVGVNMRFHVIYAEKGKVMRQGNGFARGETDEQGACKSRTIVAATASMFSQEQSACSMAVSSTGMMVASC